MEELDKRLHAFREDLADSKLKKIVSAKKYSQGFMAQIKVPVAPLYKSDDRNAQRLHEALFGEELIIFEQKEAFCWIQIVKDGYVGYMESAHIMPIAPLSKKPSHFVKEPRSFIYAKPDLKSPLLMALSMGSRVHNFEKVETRGTIYAKIAKGHYMIDAHLTPIKTPQSDYVDYACHLLHTPYLWGGASGFGLDCSGLVQLSMMMVGKNILRDTDMQQNTIGTEIFKKDGLKRGDLVFWQGHVAIMINETDIIHANGASMNVKIEPLENAIMRIAKFYGQPLCYKRP